MFLLPVSILGGSLGIASAAIALLITVFSTVRQSRRAASVRLATTLSEVLLRVGAFVSPDDYNRCQ